MEIPKRSGIYLIVLPKWKSGYIGRSSNLKRRYEEHLQNSHKEAINKYIELYSEFEFLVLEIYRWLQAKRPSYY
jgi:excinuclease UvrABC nuclease subunit